MKLLKRGCVPLRCASDLECRMRQVTSWYNKEYFEGPLGIFECAHIRFFAGRLSRPGEEGAARQISGVRGEYLQH